MSSDRNAMLNGPNQDVTNSKEATHRSDVTTFIPIVNEGSNAKLQQVIGPLIKEFRLLRESVDRKYSNLEAAIETQKAGVSTEIGKIEK